MKASEILNMNTKEYNSFVASNVENNSSFDSLYEEVADGDIISINPLYLQVRKGGEWEDARVGASMSNGPIIAAKVYGYFIIQDGHNRLKDAISNQKCEVLVQIEESEFPYLCK